MGGCPRIRDRRFRNGFQGPTAGAILIIATVSTAAADLKPTPQLPAGSFYQSRPYRDDDNDLVVVQGRQNSAHGTVAHLSGRVIDTRGRPLAGIRVEIWQSDAFGYYPSMHHLSSDDDFQGYGATITDSDGSYHFRTVRPGANPGRPPVIHFGVNGAGIKPLITQMFIGDDPRNSDDFILNRITNSQQRDSLIVPLLPAPYIEPGAVAGHFDIVVESR